MLFRRSLLLVALCNAGLAHADKVDEVIQAEMKKRQIPGLSLAIIEGGKVVKLKGYGTTERDGKVPVTPATLFQAGSVSKPVAALGALHLVEKGKLALDEDVNAKLLTWKVPENAFMAGKKVTLRGLLSHTAGLTVHGFPGYPVDVKMPTVPQILNGEAPANTGPVRVDIAPGSTSRYSGGGYTVMQQLLVDVSGKPFPQYMQDSVLAPLGMNDSSYAQPQPAKRASMAASGHYLDRSPVKGRWHLYPEMAAAGLWTNAADLSRFAIAIQQSLAGKSNPVISAKLTRDMLTDQKGGVGLGLFLRGESQALQFAHGGRDAGFDTRFFGFAETGQGAVIMINANDNSRMLERIVNVISNEYRWPDARPVPGIAASDAKFDPAMAERVAGRYEVSNNNMLALVSDNGQLVSMSDGMPDEQFAPTGPLAFRSTTSARTLTFEVDDKGAVTGFVLGNEGRDRKVPRLAPLMKPLVPLADPDAARTQKVMAAVKSAASGTPAGLIAPGKMATLGKGMKELAGIRSLVYLAEQDLGARGIERHHSKVSKLLLYRADNPDGLAYLMIFLDADGLLADYDLVDI